MQFIQHDPENWKRVFRGHLHEGVLKLEGSQQLSTMPRSRAPGYEARSPKRNNEMQLCLIFCLPKQADWSPPMQQRRSILQDQWCSREECVNQHCGDLRGEPWAPVSLSITCFSAAMLHQLFVLRLAPRFPQLLLACPEP